MRPKMLLWWSFGCFFFKLLFVFVLFEKNTENKVCVVERHFHWLARDREVAREPASGCRALLPCPMAHARRYVRAASCARATAARTAKSFPALGAGAHKRQRPAARWPQPRAQPGGHRPPPGAPKLRGNQLPLPLPCFQVLPNDERDRNETEAQTAKLFVFIVYSPVGVANLRKANLVIQRLFALGRRY